MSNCSFTLLLKVGVDVLFFPRQLFLVSGPNVCVPLAAPCVRDWSGGLGEKWKRKGGGGEKGNQKENEEGKNHEK